MAVEIPVSVPGIFTASADLSTKKLHVVKIDANFKLNVSGAGQFSYGILQNGPKATGGDCEACVIRLGVSKAVAGAAFAAGAKLAANAAGRLVLATSGTHPVAVAIEAAAADGDIVTVDVLPSAIPLV